MSLDKFPLHTAASLGDTETLERLLQSAVHRVEEKNYRNATALHCAVLNRQFAAVALLVSVGGADINAVDGQGWSSLFCAIYNKGQSMVALLLNCGADINQQTHGGWTPLHRAAWTGKADLVTTLILYGAEIDMQTNCGFTALELATQKEHKDIVLLLTRLMAQQEHARLLSLALLLNPIGLPVLAIYKIYCAAQYRQARRASLGTAWPILADIKRLNEKKIHP